jgi:hypothetical protein
MKTRITCPVPACHWYREIDHHSKHPNYIEYDLKKHLDGNHPWYVIWLKYGYWNKRRKARKGIG